MYDIYTKAQAVLAVLERAEDRIHKNRPVRVVSWLRREGLFMEQSVAYLVDALRPPEALRFRNAMATIESHYARLNNEDRAFISREAPATTGFYLSYLQDHTKILSLARRIYIGERYFPEVSTELVEVASSLVMSAAWVTKVLIPSTDPRLRGPIEARLQALLYVAGAQMEGTPAPSDYRHQIQRLNLDVNDLRVA